MAGRSFLGSSARIVVSTHALLTLTSIAYGTFGGSLTKKQYQYESNNNSVVPDAAWYQMATDLVTDMYSGKGATARQKERGVARLAQQVTFEDPAAICKSRLEVEEAFRALQLAHPTSMTKPKLVNVVPMGESIQLTYSLHQRYTMVAQLTVQSLLIVDVNLKPLQDTPQYSELEVTRMEERWNGVEPLGFAFLIPRRLNGLLSFYVTSTLMPGGPPPSSDNNSNNSSNSKRAKFFITSNGR